MIEKMNETAREWLCRCLRTLTIFNTLLYEKICFDFVACFNVQQSFVFDHLKIESSISISLLSLCENVS